MKRFTLLKLFPNGGNQEMLTTYEANESKAIEFFNDKLKGLGHSFQLNEKGYFKEPIKPNEFFSASYIIAEEFDPLASNLLKQN